MKAHELVYFTCFAFALASIVYAGETGQSWPVLFATVMVAIAGLVALVADISRGRRG